MNKSMFVGAVLGAVGVTAGGAIATYSLVDRGPEYAEVAAVQLIKEAIKTPRQVCKDAVVTRQSPIQDWHQIAGTAVGGLLGNQIGGGSSKKIAMVAGAIGSSYAGGKVQEGMQGHDTYTTTETQCGTVYDNSEKIAGYDVKYMLDGKSGHIRMDRNPGSRIPIDEHGRLILGQDEILH